MSATFYPNDWLKVALLQKLGGATQLKLPEGLTADERASVINVCKVPCLKVVVSNNVITLTVVPEEASGLIDWGDDHEPE